MMTSLDGGNTWQQTLGDDVQNDVSSLAYTGSVAYANGLWIAAAQNFVAPTNPNWQPMVSSTDGINWTYLPGTYASFTNRIAYGNGRWIITGGQLASTSLITSTTGSNFVDITGATGLPAAGSVSYSAIRYGNGRWVLGKGGQDASGNCIYTSLDGLTWSACTGDTFNNGICWDVFWNGTLWVAVGYENASPYPGAYTISTSSDGINWTRNTTATFTGIGTYTGSFGLRVTYGNGRWIAIGTDSEMLTSTDGVNWSVASPTGLTITEYIDAAWTGQQWILVGASNYPFLFTSPDGLTWSAKTIPGISTTGTEEGYGIAVKF